LLLNQQIKIGSGAGVEDLGNVCNILWVDRFAIGQPWVQPIARLEFLSGSAMMIANSIEQAR
jgi:hypothetical protein